MKRTTLGALLVILCVRAASAAQFNINDYTETELPGTPVAINASGEVLGTLKSNGDMFTWLNGVTTDLGPGTPYGINDSGQIVGQHFNGVATVGFVLTPVNPETNVITDIPNFLDAKGISDSGVILGDIGGGSAAVLSPGVSPFSPAGEYLLPSFGYETDAVAINSQNQVAYTVLVNPSSIDNNEAYNAYVYDSTGTHLIQSLGGIVTYATAMNNLGTVVGISAIAKNDYDGFSYSNGVTTDLGATFRPDGINDAGLIVGNDGGLSAVYLDGVETVIPGAAKLNAINDAGDIVGFSQDNQGQHGFIWTPIAAPEPSSIVLAVIGLIGLLAFRLRRA